MKRIKKVFGVLLSLVMVFLLFPASAKADNTENTGNSGVVVEKSATLENDGTYTINLSAYATGTTTTITEKSGQPLDIVLVLDQSGSMKNYGYLDSLKTAVGNFIDTITQNAKEYNVDHRIAVVGFAGAAYGSGTDSEYYYANTELFIGSKQYNYISGGKESTEDKIASTQYASAFQVVTDSTGATNLTASKDALAAKGGTHPDLGIEMANGIFEANDNTYTKTDGTAGTRKRIMVVFTDGQPGDSAYSFDSDVANDALRNAYATKNTYGATVYTVGLYSNASNNVTTFMNYLSSNYPSAQSMSSYVYTPVYDNDLDRNETYYINDDGSYVPITYNTNKNAWRRNKQNYTPKTSEDDTNNNHTQFYMRTNASAPEKAADKYYMTTSDSSELNKIFSNVTEDIQNPSTTVTLNAESVMRDVIADGFKLPSDYNVASNVTIKTVAGSTTDGKTITWGAETINPNGITASVDGQNVNITGFNYSEKYVAESHNGEKLMVEIRGVEATDAAITNEQVDTNAAASGIYATADAESCIPFPQPKTILTSEAYVLDYAKSVTLSSSDWNQDSVTKIAGDMAKNSAAVAAKYGKIDLNNNNVIYQPTTTNWDGYDSFYAFGKTSEPTITAASANANGNLWTKVSVLPANNVYYEDDFVTDESNSTVGIEYTGTWTTEGTSTNNTETANGAVQGWETSLADDATYSDGTAHVSNTSGATAKFTFTGTGVDIYSRTNQTTGTIYVTVKSTKDGTTTTNRTVVDNKAKSGDYYQIPTYTFSGDYDTYEVTVRVTTGAASEGRYTYYLDGIRVYNPIKNQESDSTVQEAYRSENLKAVFTEVRGLLDVDSGVAFVDEGESGKPVSKSYSDAEVSALAPEHEVYLAKNQSIVVGVEAADTYYIGLKAPNGETEVALSADENAATTKIAHASDLYYKVTPNDGKIVIKNTGDNLLSITKIRTTGTGESGISMMSIDDPVSAVMLFNAAPQVAYQSVGATDEELTEAETPVVTEPEDNESDETVTEEPGEVIIENPDVSDEEPAETPSVPSNNWISDLFSRIRNIFGRR